MNPDNLLYGLIIILLILVVFETCTYPKSSPVEKFEERWQDAKGVWMPYGWLKPRLWYSAPGSYGNLYGEELLSCMDSCAGRLDRDDCLKYCKRIYPTMMGFDREPHHGMTALKPGVSGNPELDVGKKEYPPVL